MKCGRVALIRENYQVFGIIEKYGSTFTDGTGGFNLVSVKTALDLEGTPPENQSVFTEKIISYMLTAISASHENRK
jgi:hypothetical protein